MDFILQNLFFILFAFAALFTALCLAQDWNEGNYGNPKFNRKK